MNNNIINEIKSTIIGLILIAIAILFLAQDFESWHLLTNKEIAIASTLFTVGLLLLFARDTIIGTISAGVKKLMNKLIGK